MRRRPGGGHRRREDFCRSGGRGFNVSRGRNSHQAYFGEFRGLLFINVLVSNSSQSHKHRSIGPVTAGKPQEKPTEPSKRTPAEASKNPFEKQIFWESLWRVVPLGW